MVALKAAGRGSQREEMYGWSAFTVSEDGILTSTRNLHFDRFTEPLMLYRIMSAMMIYSLRDNNPIWDAGDSGKWSDRVGELAINRDNLQLSIPCRVWLPMKNWPANLGRSGAGHSAQQQRGDIFILMSA